MLTTLPPLYVIDGLDRGGLATMARPPGGHSLYGAMCALREAGTDVLVSALTRTQVCAGGLDREPDAAAAAGLRLVWFPVPNSAAPDLMATGAIARRLAGQIAGGRFVAIHCWAGIGRASLLAGSVLVTLGVAPDEAWRRIADARGLPVPETEEQRVWLHDFAATRTG